MTDIQLKSGESYVVPVKDLQATVRVATKNGARVRATAPGADTGGTPTTLLLKRIPLESPTTIELAPGAENSAFPPKTDAIITVVVRGLNLSIQLPTYSLAGLRHFEAATLTPIDGGVELRAARTTVIEESEDGLVEALAGTLQSFREGSSEASLQATRPRRFVVLRDASASMGRSFDEDTLDAMTTVLGAIIKDADNAQAMTSSSSIEPREVSGKASLEQYFAGVPVGEDVGWTRDIRDLEDEAILLVLSDDVPAAVINHPGPTYVLSTQRPVGSYPENIGVTVFDAELKRKLRSDQGKRRDTAMNEVMRSIHTVIDREERRS